MRSVAVSVVRLVVQLAAVAPVLGAVSDITDLAIFSSLAPCAASAVSAIVQELTASECPSDVTALQSCACTKDSNSAAVATTLSNSILSDYCATTASEDVSSASVVFNYYCNQAGAAPSFSNAAVPVSQYITDLAAYSALAPCAYQGVFYAVHSLTYRLCPTGQAALASCACLKDKNSLVVGNSISSEVFNGCGSTHSADISSAEAVFAGYCGLVAGTTSFPTPSALPGHLTYYVTDLPQFSSLAPCAASAVSAAILGQTALYCPSDPEDLVSCVCVKDSNSVSISRYLTSQVKEYCESTASEDVSSGIAILDFYCSAGGGLVTPTGITNSVQVTGYSNGGGAAATTGAAATGVGANPSTPQKTGTSGSNGGSSGSNGSNNPSATSSSNSTSNVPLIAGVAGGVVGVIAIIGIIWAIWFCQRRKRMRMTAMPLVTPPPPPVNEKTYFPGGKSELDNTPLVSDMPPQHNRGLSTPTPISTVSPDSIYARPATGKASELSPQNATIRTAASPSVAEMSGRSVSEMQGQGIAVSTPGPNPGVYEMQDYGGQTVYGQALGGASPYGLKDSGGPPYAQVQGGAPPGPQYAQVQGGASPGPQYAQVQGGASPGPGVAYAPYYGQGYGPPQSQYPNPNPSQGPYEMPSQQWG